MSANFLLADVLSALKNCKVRNTSGYLDVPFNKLCFAVCAKLKDFGYIKDCVAIDVRKGVKNIRIYPNFDTSGKNVISSLSLVSKPGCRVSKNVDELKYMVLRDVSATFLISTSFGVMSAIDSIENRSGGEVLCKIV